MRELVRYFPELRTNEEFVRDGKMLADEVDYWRDKKEQLMFADLRLREYQNKDAYYLKERGSCLVLNEPRTGKTPTMITVLKALGTKRNLVICPSSLVLNWAKEFKQWYPEIKVYPITGNKNKRIQIYADCRATRYTNTVIIISKDTWKLDEALHELTFDTAIVDEAHFLRNWKSNSLKRSLK